jgi:nucleotide-binding universal stress UspA family protein
MKLNVEIQGGRKTTTPRTVKKNRGFTERKSQAGFKTIVVPIDFSETSLWALDYALALAVKFGARIHLVHVLELPILFDRRDRSLDTPANRDAKKSATSRLDGLVTEKIDELITTNTEVRSGRAYQMICAAAQEHKADLIVIGTHGFTGLKHLLLGSTAERVIRHAPCSVLVVGRQATRNVKSFVEPKNILVPTDFSQPAEQALESAIAFFRQFQSQLHLLYVVPIYYGSGEYDTMEYTLLAADEKDIGKKKLEQISRKLAAENIPATTQVRHGRTAVEINAAAGELDCDLIVISTRGLTGWQHTLLGSTTEEVVRHSFCPVLVVRKK